VRNTNFEAPPQVISSHLLLFKLQMWSSYRMV